ncbi:plasma-membrane proton-efflux P-type ATPase [Desulfothermobacter acidiphilus]|uniref:plasma-membrane proton-efflux P-type ATPase n=1 Tax=Desulfothermobacter acidiphilus TaxID=1938353 RepID=UPI003F89FF7F
MPEEQSTKRDFQHMTLEELWRELRVNPSQGLTGEEVKRRLRDYGYNEVPEHRVSPWLLLARKFWGLTAWMLEAVILLSLILHKYLDMYIVAALLVFNALLGFWQERKAAKAVDALKAKLQVNARVLREGKWQLLPARQLVPGDIVRIRAGDFVPADVKLFSGQVEVDQSALTGESLTVSRRASDMVFSGSIIKRGEAEAAVVLTGTRTYFGRTAELVQLARPKLHAEEVTTQVVKWLLVVVGVALAAALGTAWLLGFKLLELLPLALILLASSIPVALPAMFTITMSLGALELARKGVLVTRLSASEDAATMDTLCVDKTGTITLNQLTLAGLSPLGEYTEEEVLRWAALSSQEADQDPIDLAILSAAAERSIQLEPYRQVSFVPFDPQKKRTEAVVEADGRRFQVMKGAVQTIAALTRTDLEKLRREMETYAAKGYRTLAVAVGQEGLPLQLAGLLALYDPPHPDARTLIKELLGLGLRIKMLTGDAQPIAREIARQVGLGDNIVNAAELREKWESHPEEAAAMAEESDGFAEVYPEDKYNIVKGLQSRGHVVGMTGDGVNDAPPLRQAEVGIAVSNATDVAKGAASVVLTGSGLANIVDLVKTGRMIYQRVLTWVFNKIVKTFQIVLFVVLAFFWTKHFVVSTFDVVLLLFLIDFVTLAIATDNARWSSRPDTWNIKDITKSSLVLGLLVVAESLLLLYLGFERLGENYQLIRTYSLAILFYLGLLTVFVVRERGHFWSSLPSRALFWIVVADIGLVTLLLTQGIPGLLAPLPWSLLLEVLGLSLFFSLVVNDLVKYWLLRPGRRA